MIKKLFNQKKAKSNKRGSMLTLVLVILVMAIILITSAITITNSTRARYYDYTLTNQARTMCTSVAETFATAISTQEILDTELEAMAAAGTTVSAGGVSVPGLNGAGDTSTTVTFSCDKNWIYMDVSTTIGKLNSGSSATENVRVYFKAKEPTVKTNLFAHMMEIGDNASFSSFNVGMGAPAGRENTVFIHGNGDLTKNGGNNMYSDIITTGRLKLGNGGTIQGYMLFAGPDAGLQQQNSGSPQFNDVYFMSPSGYSQGRIVPNSTDNIDITAYNGTVSITTYNFNVNTNLRYNNVQYYDAGQTDINSTNYANINNSYIMNAGNAEMSAKASTMLAKAVEALKEENKYPTIDQASPTFLLNVDMDHLQQRVISGAAGEYTLEPGIYHLSGQYNGKYNCDESKGAYIFYVDANTTVPAGCFSFTGGDANDDSNWGRFIIAAGVTFKIGGYDAGSNVIGIVSTDHSATPGPAVAGSKPTCYVYGYAGSRFEVDQGKHTVDAYVGLYGDGSTIKIHSTNYLYGRFSATNFESDNANGTNLPYCPGPHENATANTKTPKSSKYEVARFRYYYGTPA